MNPPLQYEPAVKREEHEGQRMRVKQEERLEEHAPIFTPKIEPAVHHKGIISSQEAKKTKKQEKKALNSTRRNPAAKSLKKRQRRALHFKALKDDNARLCQELLRKEPPRKIDTNKSTASTTTRLQMEIHQLEKQLKNAKRDGENARRDLRAYKKSMAREKERFEAVLNERFEEVKADNDIKVSNLENRLAEEKAKTGEAHGLLRQSGKLVAQMTSLFKGQGRSVH